MLELRLYTTKQSIEQELARKDDDDDDVNDQNVENDNNKRSTTTTMTTTTIMTATKTSSATATATAAAAAVAAATSRANEIEAIRMELSEARESHAQERAHFEHRMREKDVELVELERQCSALKRKYQKVCEQIQDVERASDEYKVRNRELERIQAKFDADMAALRSKWEEERESRERCEREREQCKYELFAVKSDLETQKLETVYHQEKCERLEKDLKVTNFMTHSILFFSL